MAEQQALLESSWMFAGRHADFKHCRPNCFNHTLLTLGDVVPHPSKVIQGFSILSKANAQSLMSVPIGHRD